MLVKIKGKAKNISNNITRKAARFYGDRLLGPRLSKNVFVEVCYKDLGKNSNDYAWCDWLDTNYRAREFCITIHDKLTRKESLLALAHEMVHLKQYAKGELKNVIRPTKAIKYLGESYDIDNHDYWELPWEIEAFGREQGLYFKFLVHMDEKRMK